MFSFLLPLLFPIGLASKKLMLCSVFVQSFKVIFIRNSDTNLKLWTFFFTAWGLEMEILEILTKNGSFTYFAKANCRFPESYDWTLLASSTILQINLLDQ